MSPLSTTDLLSGVVPLRGESVVWRVYDRDENYLGVLMLDRDNPPTITNDTDRPVRRTVDNLSIIARPRVDRDTSRYYADDLDVLSMRVRPWWLLSNDAEFPLGWFRWGDDSTKVYSWGRPREASLVDFCSVLDQPLDGNLGFGVGQNVGAALLAIAQGAGFSMISIDATTVILSAPIAWVAGRDTRMKAMESLCSLAGFLPPYFDNSGTLVCRGAPELTYAEAAFSYGWGAGGVRDGSIVESNDLLSAPNRYVVVDGSSGDAPRVGRFDVPDVAPHSFMNRGFYIVRTINLQGMDTATANLDAVAAAAYASDTASYQWLGFASAANPLHDTFDVVEFDGAKYREQSWRLECKAGGAMDHDLRGAY